jgi:hypothetical protein
MIDDATLVRVTNVSALTQWVSAFSRFGPFVTVTRNRMNTVDLVTRAKCNSCAGVWYSSLFVWPRLMAGEVCKKMLFAVSLGWITNFEANSFDIRYRMEYIYCISQTVFCSKSLLMASSSNVQVQIKTNIISLFLPSYIRIQAVPELVVQMQPSLFRYIRVP